MTFLNERPSCIHPLALPWVTVLIVPTGIGACVGGYAGDATPVMRLLASVSDVLVTHPNVANAAMFIDLPANALYVEGYGLDQWMQGRWALHPVRSNRIGLLWDAGIPAPMRQLNENVLAAVTSVFGVSIAGQRTTSAPLALCCALGPSGSANGSLDNPEVLWQAAELLIHEDGATALAVLGYFSDALMAPFGDATDAKYEQASGVDPIGGLEALLSHAVTALFRVPCAHAPVFDVATAMPVLDRPIAGRAASEYIGGSFLPCVLRGLARAPQYAQAGAPHDASLRPSVVVAPSDALGGVSVLAALASGVPVIAVSENTSQMRVSPAAFSGTAPIYPVATYLEASGLVQAMRLGMDVGVFLPSG